MLADHLTKERGGDQLYEIIKINKIKLIDKYDNSQITSDNIRDAAIDVASLNDPEILHVDVKTVSEDTGQDAGEQSSSASDSTVPDRQLACGRNSRQVQSGSTSAPATDDQNN